MAAVQYRGTLPAGRMTAGGCQFCDDRSEAEDYGPI